MKQKKSEGSYPTRATNVPVTQRMLYCVRDELKSDFRAVETRVSGVETRLSKVRDELKSDIKAVETKLESKFESLFHQLSGQIHRVGILVEEQNAKNNIVLDGLANLFERQERLEAKFDGVAR